MGVRKDFMIQKEGTFVENGFIANKLVGSGLITSARDLQKWLSEIWGPADETISGTSSLKEIAAKINGRNGVYIILDDGSNKVKDHATLWLGECGDVIGGNHMSEKGGTIYFWELKGASHMNIKIEADTFYYSLDKAAIVAANKIYENMKTNGTYEYGVTIFKAKAKNVERYYMTGVRKGTRWDIQHDGNAYLDYEIDRLRKSIDGNDKNLMELEPEYVAHMHSHPIGPGIKHVFSTGDFCEAYVCDYKLEYRCNGCDRREICDYTARRSNAKCEDCNEFIADAGTCLKIHKLECKYCDKKGKCGKSTIVTYLVADLTNATNYPKSYKQALIRFEPPSREDIFEELHTWTRRRKEPSRGVFSYFNDNRIKAVEATPFIDKDINSIIEWEEIDYPY
jgi:hypothetical protein